jgi:hypothetical protein
MKYNLTFKKYKKYCIGNKIFLPVWFNENRYNTIIHMLEANNETANKIRIIKMLRDWDQEHTKDNTISIGLKELKSMVDVFDRFLIVLTQEQTPPHPQLINLKELNIVLAPFVNIANEHNRSSNFVPNQIVFAFNGNYITTDDLASLRHLMSRINTNQNLNKQFKRRSNQ